ncbi:low-density lipoprotein receptor-related protein 10 isoform X2 [Coregonus clupeaformis]|uniref:low-density lipoprotein receptor-related protein 10 isoform X2 n=1 Tax=Coregonus clupeaformis TaxID=59861 RepID=UPI001E1C60A7|nr:low-density lipoprotein receptor-related protein 10 isoform X2 [Coregonus clupeaformis]
MTVSFNLCVINILFVTAYSSLELASSTAHCGRPPQVLEAARGEIRSSVHHSWSYRPRPFNCSWIIKAHVGEPVILSFSQFSTRCKKEWVSVTSSTGKPITLCGSNLPKPMELMGGNITVTHHFLPHLFPVSTFRLGYVRDSGDCTAVDFECLGGRCLPLSWRCNGRVECLGEGVGIDEQDCNGEIKILNLDPEHSKTVVATATPESYRERETEREKNRGSNSRARDWETVGKAPGELEKEEEKTEKEVDADGDHTKEKEPANPIDDFWQFQPRRLPSPQPHRAHPSVNRAPIEWPCGGLLQTFYGTFAPPSIRGPPLFCVWTLDPQDSRPLKLDLWLLELGPGDTVTITNRQQGTGELIKTITSASNYKAIQVESQTGLLSLTYRTLPGSEGLGFNATYRVGGYCPPWEGKCGGAAGGCYTQEQKCDGHWDCPETGHDEAGCRGCPRDQFACGGAGQRAVLAGHNFIGRLVCFPAKERCNYQLYCSDGSDERDCSICQPGTFHCDSDRCVFESWRCDGQLDCKDGTDELNCTVTLPPKVITCGGLLQTFYGTFAPPSIRGPPLFCVWTLDPQDSRPLKLDLRLLELGPGDTVTITNRQQGTGELIKTITNASNYKAIQVESQTGLLSLTYRTLPGSEGLGFNATYRVGGYCPPWEGKCGGAAGGCYTQEQKCDGHWDCPETGHDEAGCRGCPRDQFACGGAGQRAVLAGHNFIGRPVCFPAKERCNYQLYCSDGSDERDCSICQPGTFHCDSDRCVFESWRCDGQVDCKDGTDELNCSVTLPRKVITAATVGSLVCGLLLVIAMGCTCKLYSLRTREYSMFAPISRQEAELIQQQAPPSYGQLIAQGIIPPVEDFPTENPNESSSLTLRGILHLLRQDTANSPRRRHRPRFVRRAVRRMRRWGLIPRPASRPSQPSSSAPQQTDPASTGVEPSQSTPATSSLAVEAVNLPLPQKLGLLPQTVPHQPPPPPSLPPPHVSIPASPQSFPVAAPPTISSPSLASLFHSLGRGISRFRASQSSPTNSLPLSASPSFSSSSEDEVLLIPFSEDMTSEDDVPLLTLDT